MRCNTLQILWHNKQPVFSVDFNRNGELATGGADKEIRLWRVFDSKEDKSKSDVEYLCSLTAHSKTVNAVRFSPDGNSIVSAGDSGEVVMWRKVSSNDNKKGKGEREETGGFRESANAFHGNANNWKAVGSLRGQTDDVQDLAWSPDGTAVVTGSIENVAFLWDAEKHRSLARLDGHHHYIQGVAWDPLGEYIITQSGDRSCRIYAPKAVKSKVLAKGGCVGIASRIRACGVVLQRVLSKPLSEDQETQAAQTQRDPTSEVDGTDKERLEQPLPTSSNTAAAVAEPTKKKQKLDRQSPPFLFHDENMPSFFRRLSWSPDGSFLACPAGLYKRETDNKLGNCVHIFKRGQWSKPLLTLPALSKAVVAVKFCPVLFEHRKKKPEQQSTDCAEEETNTNTNTNTNKEKRQPVKIAIKKQEEETKKRIRDAKDVFDLPYLIYFAVVTLDSVILYETSSSKPVALMSGLHCASLTDLAWSPDGRKMAVSSHDGYCSFISFDEGELGVQLSPEQKQKCVEAEVQKHAKENSHNNNHNHNHNNNHVEATMQAKQSGKEKNGKTDVKNVNHAKEEEATTKKTEMEAQGEKKEETIGKRDSSPQGAGAAAGDVVVVTAIKGQATRKRIAPQPIIR